MFHLKNTPSKLKILIKYVEYNTIPGEMEERICKLVV